MAAIAELLDGRDAEYKVTLDGNEQYREMDSLIGLIEALAAEQPRLYERILYVEQPLERSVALDAALESGIRAAAAHRPLLIDESDDAQDTFRQALALGYEGVSSKACKGLVKALANLGVGAAAGGLLSLGRGPDEPVGGAPAPRFGARGGTWGSGTSSATGTTTCGGWIT